ncbi:MAG: hypothetical protein H5T71_10990, partial [Chloroflexi bacterium]|nr:hypothetical protein [Chloroflexota bacterium]
MRSREAVLWVDRSPDSGPLGPVMALSSQEQVAPPGPELLGPTEGQGGTSPDGPSLLPPERPFSDAPSFRVPPRPVKVIVYLEGGVKIETGAEGGAQLTDKTWFGRLYTLADVETYVGQVAGEPDPYPPVFRRAMTRRNAEAEGITQRALRPEDAGG